MKFIYKIIPRVLWEDACKTGVFTGAPVDQADGFIHFSTALQIAETANKHFRGQKDLLLLRVPEDVFGKELCYEISRNNAFFPHLYGELPVHLVQDVISFESDKYGLFSFTELK